MKVRIYLFQCHPECHPELHSIMNSLYTHHIVVKGYVEVVCFEDNTGRNVPEYLN